METLTFDEVRLLAQQRQPGISIYQPTHRTSPDNQQDPIRFKNLVREAERRLGEIGHKPREIEELLAPAVALIEESLFWRHVYDGLAVFVAPGDFHVYHLPFPVDERVVIAQSYYVKPMLAQFTNNGHYFVLAFSQNEVRLFEGTRYSIGQVKLPAHVPTNLEEAVGAYDEQVAGVQARSLGGGSGAQYFGGSGTNDVRKVRIEQYLNLLDASLRPIFVEHRAPVVLAGVDYLLPIYRSQSEYTHILAEGIPGNPDLLRPAELHARAWPLVEPYFRQATDEVIEQYEHRVAQGQATDDLGEAVAAAYFGRIDKLLIAVDSDVWGHLDSDSGMVTQLHGEQNTVDDLALLDFAAMQTIARGGTVYALPYAELPTNSPVLAVLRY